MERKVKRNTIFCLLRTKRRISWFHSFYFSFRKVVLSRLDKLYFFLCSTFFKRGHYSIPVVSCFTLIMLNLYLTILYFVSFPFDNSSFSWLKLWFLVVLLSCLLVPRIIVRFLIRPTQVIRVKWRSYPQRWRWQSQQRLLRIWPCHPPTTRAILLNTS